MRKRKGNSAGFTLVELLVAMAIFMLLMGSIMVLFLGTVRTVRQGYSMLDTMDRARASMAALERDVKTAFASPEKSDYFQFYGESAGFVYIGALTDGSFGRVSYVMHRDTDREVDTIILLLPWAEVLDKVVKRMEEDKNDDGVGDVTMFGVAPQMDSATGHLTTAALDQVRAAFRQHFEIAAASLGTEPVAFSIQVVPGVMLRYEESGQANLGGMGDESDVSAAGGNTETPTAYSSMVNDIDEAYALAQDSGLDRILSLEKHDKLVRLEGAHRLLQRLSYRLGTPGYLPLTRGNDQVQFVPCFWQEDYNQYIQGGESAGALPPGVATKGANNQLPKWHDYMLVDNVLVGAWLCEPDSPNVLTGFDSALQRAVLIPALDMQAFFAYGTENNAGGPVFNTLYNLSAIVKRPVEEVTDSGVSYLSLFQQSEDTATRAEALLKALAFFIEEKPEFGYTLGDPLSPRAPAWITPGFWIYGEAPGPSSPPTCTWFAQRVDLPSAFMRKSVE